MTKLQSAEKILEQKGKCHDVDCEDCFLEKRCRIIPDTLKESRDLAIKYIKEKDRRNRCSALIFPH